MKAVLSKTSGLITMGVLQACRCFGRAEYVKMIPAASFKLPEAYQRGLEAAIDPPLDFTNSGDLIEPRDSNQVYCVILIIQDHKSSEKEGAWEPYHPIMENSSVLSPSENPN
uniref:AlNc14C4G631 protein n=1 Tax=Albugo laibachii Nc14 TaxID=890382 RepID=F0W0I9_9STRA|nr:AlNc14C4G631 [Albugo laibachii Nc14]|eukprot:CCA14561.1 AlNc14C4G631 [Albugo laibachii Nc14]